MKPANFISSANTVDCNSTVKDHYKGENQVKSDEKRAKAVREVIGLSIMSGASPSAAFVHLSEKYACGKITLQQFSDAISENYQIEN